MILLFCLLVQSCFFKKKGNRLITRPMKGTITCGYSTKEKLENKIWLANDSKNRAENMIVDLLRKDMGRISGIGSVKVTKLCEVKQYSTVWQMTSTIESQLQSDKSLLDSFFCPFSLWVNYRSSKDCDNGDYQSVRKATSRRLLWDDWDLSAEWRCYL